MIFHLPKWIGVAAAGVACLLLPAAEAAAAPIYVHLGQLTAMPKYTDRPMRPRRGVDSNTCGTARIDANRNVIRIEAQVRGRKVRRRAKAQISFVDGVAVSSKPVPLVGILSLHGAINASAPGEQTRRICVKHSRLAARMVTRKPRSVVLRDMRIETWPRWRDIHPDVFRDAETDDLRSYRRLLFATLHLRGYTESDHRRELQKVCDDVHSRNEKFAQQGIDFSYPEDWACSDRGISPS